MNPAADNTSLQPSERADLAWDAVNDSDYRIRQLCAELIADQYPQLDDASDVIFAIYRGTIGPAEIDTQVRELIAREASKLRRTP